MPFGIFLLASSPVAEVKCFQLPLSFWHDSSHSRVETKWKLGLIKIVIQSLSIMWCFCCTCTCTWGFLGEQGVCMSLVKFQIGSFCVLRSRTCPCCYTVFNPSLLFIIYFFLHLFILQAIYIVLQDLKMKMLFVE